MTPTQALRDLLVKVESGKRGIGLNTVSVFGNTQSAMDAVDAFDGSLDAAKALHEAVLPGWGFAVTQVGANIEGPTEFYSDDANNPARAWLICILRALIAQATP